MGDFSSLGGGVYESAGEDLSTTRGTTITAAATANTKGSWTELIAATSFPHSGVYVHLFAPIVESNALVDIGIGAVGSEVVLIPDLMMPCMTSGYSASYFFPLRIPSGQRLSARMQADAASETRDVYLTLIAQGLLAPQGLNRVTAYGVNTADSGGVMCDPGGTTHTKTRTEIVASTASPIKGITVGYGYDGSDQLGNGYWIYDIEAGAVASEQVVVANALAHARSNEMAAIGFGFHYPCAIPAGSRLAINIQSDQLEAWQRRLDFVLYGID